MPTKLRLLRGTQIKHPVNEPEPKLDIPDCPEHLNEEARAEWSRVAEELYRVGVLAGIDRAVLACYCECWSRIVKLSGIVERVGEVIQKDGMYYPNPYLGQLNKAYTNLRSFASELGLSAAARTKINARPEQVDSVSQLARRRETGT